MKNRILILLGILLCVAACKKSEVIKSLKFTKVTFVNKSLNQDMQIGSESKYYSFGYDVPAAYGDDRFTIVKTSTKKIILDTILNISGGETFFVNQADTTQRPVISRSPLSGVSPAPPGYMKIKIANLAAIALPYAKVDIVVLPFYATNGVYIPLDTLHDVTANYTDNDKLYIVKRQVIGDVVQQLYKFSYINPNTGLPLLNNQGAVYTNTSFSATLTKENLFMVSLGNTTTSIKTTSMLVNGKYYNVSATIALSR